MTTASACFGWSPKSYLRFRRMEGRNAQDRKPSHADLCSHSVECSCVGTNLRICGPNIQSGIDSLRGPNLRILRSANSAGRGEITSRRLTCSKDQSWVNTNSLCLVAYTSADHAEDAFRKFQASYCPRLPVNHAELLKAISEETEKFFSLAPRSQVLVAVQAICRRYANLSEQCQAMIEGLAASGN